MDQACRLQVLRADVDVCPDRAGLLVDLVEHEAVQPIEAFGESVRQVKRARGIHDSPRYKWRLG
jgi:hypothetical protein